MANKRPPKSGSGKRPPSLEQIILQIFTNNPSTAYGYKAIHSKVGRRGYDGEEVVAAVNRLWEKKFIDKQKGNRFQLKGAVVTDGKPQRNSRRHSTTIKPV